MSLCYKTLTSLFRCCATDLNHVPLFAHRNKQIMKLHHASQSWELLSLITNNFGENLWQHTYLFSTCVFNKKTVIGKLKVSQMCIHCFLPHRPTKTKYHGVEVRFLTYWLLTFCFDCRILIRWCCVVSLWSPIAEYHEYRCVHSERPVGNSRCLALAGNAYDRWRVSMWWLLDQQPMGPDRSSLYHWFSVCYSLFVWNLYSLAHFRAANCSARISCL